MRPRRESIEIETEIETGIFFVKKLNLLTTLIFIFPKIQTYISNKLSFPACYKKALLYVVAWRKSCLRHNIPANAQVLYRRLCVALKSEFFISKKHLKPRSERNRENLFNVINYILADQVTIMKTTLYYRAEFPKLCVAANWCAVKGSKVCREIFVFLTESHRVNGGYWVRRMRQLPRAPLENTTYSFIFQYMFF